MAVVNYLGTEGLLTVDKGVMKVLNKEPSCVMEESTWLDSLSIEDSINTKDYWPTFVKNSQRKDSKEGSTTSA